MHCWAKRRQIDVFLFVPVSAVPVIPITRHVSLFRPGSVMKLYPLQIKMDTTKYGVSLSALKSLQDFQRSLLNKKRKIFAMPFHGECWLSINDREPVRSIITANPGSVSCEAFGVIYLKNCVKSISETDTEVVLEGKGLLRLFETMAIKFDNQDDKIHFMTSIENVLISSDSDDSSSSGSSSSDSGIQ